MKTQKVKSLFDIPYDDVFPVAKEEHRGKWSIFESDGKDCIMIILPCGHLASLTTWNVSGIYGEKPSATPSIFCKGQINHTDCWHGYLTDGKLMSV